MSNVGGYLDAADGVDDSWGAAPPIPRARWQAAGATSPPLAAGSHGGMVPLALPAAMTESENTKDTSVTSAFCAADPGEGTPTSRVEN